MVQIILALNSSHLSDISAQFSVHPAVAQFQNCESKIAASFAHLDNAFLALFPELVVFPKPRAVILVSGFY
jgi:hypothetical protein